jgi:type I restriction enzyme, S subunit
MASNWPWVELRQVMRLDLNKVPVDPEIEYPMVGVYSFGRGLFMREPVSGNNTSYRFFYQLKADHVVMSQLFGWEGALALSSERFSGLFVSPQFPTFLCDEEKLDRNFLGWLIRQKTVWGDLGSRTKGMGDRRRTLNPEALLSTHIPLPPLDEQRRIVARIEELAERVEEAQALSTDSSAETQAFWQSTLQRIFNEHQNEAKTLDDCSTFITDGTHVTPNYVDFGIPFITVRNIAGRKLSFENLKYIDKEQHEIYCGRVKAEYGDVLYTKDGTLGVPCFVDTERDFSFFVSVAIIKPKHDLLDGRYLAYMLDAPQVHQQVITTKTGAVLQHIVIRAIKSINIPIPSLDEQQRILAYLDSVQARVGLLGQLQFETRKKLSALLPSILDRAFKGEL